MHNDKDEQAGNQPQQNSQQDSTTSGSYIEKDPDDWKTGSEPKMNSQKSKPSDTTGNPSDESFKEETLPKTNDKVSGSNAEKDPDEWVTGAEPMTGAQKSYLKTLCDEAGESFDENLSKAEASKRIDELQHKTGRGLNNK